MNNEKKEKVKKPFYKKWWFWLIVFFISLTAIPTNKDNNTEKNNTKTALEKDKNVNKNIKTETKSQKNEEQIVYEVKRIDNSNIANIKRYSYYVVIKGTPTKKQIQKYADEICTKAKKATPFNALTIYFYDWAEFIGKTSRYGSIVYAPDGIFTNASKVKTGDYSKLKYISNITEIEGDFKLSQNDAQIFAYFMDLLTELNNDSSMAYDEIENLATERTCKKFQITNEELNRITIYSSVFNNSEDSSPKKVPNIKINENSEILSDPLISIISINSAFETIYTEKKEDGTVILQSRIPNVGKDEAIIELASKLVAQVCGEVFSKSSDVKKVSCSFFANMIDVYGKETFEEVVLIEMSRETAEKINFENFITMVIVDYNKLLNVTSWYIHPGIQKNLNKLFLKS